MLNWLINYLVTSYANKTFILIWTKKVMGELCHHVVQAFAHTHNFSLLAPGEIQCCLRQGNFRINSNSKGVINWWLRTMRAQAAWFNFTSISRWRECNFNMLSFKSYLPGFIVKPKLSIGCYEVNTLSITHSAFQSKHMNFLYKIKNIKC